MQDRLSRQPLASAHFHQELPYDHCRELIQQQLVAPSPMFASQGRIFSHADPHFCLQFESVQLYVREQLDKAAMTMASGNHFQALREFRWVEMVVDVYLEHAEGELPEDIVLLLLCNLGVCFYRYGFYDDAFSCFDSCEGRLNSRLTYFDRYVDEKAGALDPQAFSDQLRLTRLRLLYGRLKLANGVIFEQVGRKYEALRHYKEAVCVGVDLLMDLVMFVMVGCGLAGQKNSGTVNQYRNRPAKKKKSKVGGDHEQLTRSLSGRRRSLLEPRIEEGSCQQRNTRRNANNVESVEGHAVRKTGKRLQHLLERPADKLLFIFYKNTEDIFPYFRKANEKNCFFKKLMNRHPSVNEIELPVSRIKEAFVKGHSLYSQNISTMLEPKQVILEELNQPFLHKPMDTEFVLQLITHLTLSLFQLSVLRMTTESKTKSQSSRTLSEIQMNKCMELLYLFLPLNSVFAKEIVKQHNELFGIYKQTIPEYGGFSEQIKFLKSSLNSGECTRLFVPCIRSLQIKRPLDSSDSEESIPEKILMEAEYNCPKLEEPRESFGRHHKNKKKSGTEEQEKQREDKGRQTLPNPVRKQQPNLFTKILKLIDLDAVLRRSKPQTATKQKKCRQTHRGLNKLKSSGTLPKCPEDYRVVLTRQLLKVSASTPSTRSAKSPRQ